MSKISKVTFVGVNYEGTMYRCIPSQTDYRPFQIDLVGTEDSICSFAMHNCNYGPDILKELTLDCFVKQLNDMSVAQFEGCGGILKLVQSGTVLYDSTDEFAEVLGNQKILNLGELNLAETDPNNHNLINELIRKLFKTHPEQFASR